jgi:hypothetical protein
MEHSIRLRNRGAVTVQEFSRTHLQIIRKGQEECKSGRVKAGQSHLKLPCEGFLDQISILDVMGGNRGIYAPEIQLRRKRLQQRASLSSTNQCPRLKAETLALNIRGINAPAPSRQSPNKRTQSGKDPNAISLGKEALTL